MIGFVMMVKMWNRRQHHQLGFKVTLLRKLQRKTKDILMTGFNTNMLLRLQRRLAIGAEPTLRRPVGYRRKLLVKKKSGLSMMTIRITTPQDQSPG
jgi:hypothetical protein